ncbi:MAG: hypothetical protein ABIS18_01450 [Actinomycetota bacterium]
MGIKVGAVGVIRSVFGWRKLQLLGGLLIGISAAFQLGIHNAYVAVPLGALGIGLVLSLLLKRVGALWMGTVFGLDFGVKVFLGRSALLYVDTPVAFMETFLYVIGGVLVVLSTIPALLAGKGPEPSSISAWRIGVGSLLLVVSVIVASLVAGEVLGNESTQAGDVKITAADFVLTPSKISHEPGIIPKKISDNHGPIAMHVH